MITSSKQSVQTSDWSNAVEQINALELGAQMTAAIPFSDRDASLRISQPFLKPAHGPADAAWIVGEWLVDELASKGIHDLIESADHEFETAFGDSMYEIDRTDQFVTWIGLFLTSPYGSKARDKMPYFSIAFEIWLKRIDALLLERLHAFRQICVDYGNGARVGSRF